jgi:uncharacterized damage-inducible protein DinB
MGQADRGLEFPIAIRQQLIAEGYSKLENFVKEMPDSGWADPVDTPFFGRVSKARLFYHILFHNSHHAGQISLTLAKGNHTNLNLPTVQQDARAEAECL